MNYAKFLAFMILLLSGTLSGVPSAYAGFLVGAQSSYDQIKVAEPGINATLGTTPGTALTVGFEYNGGKSASLFNFGAWTFHFKTKYWGDETRIGQHFWWWNTNNVFRQKMVGAQRKCESFYSQFYGFQTKYHPRLCRAGFQFLKNITRP